MESSQLQNWDSEVDGLAFNVQVLGTDDQAANHRIPLLTPFLLYLYRYTLFYTAASVHSTAKQLLQIIHTSLAHRKSFHVKPSERYHPAKVFMLGRTGTNELQMWR